VSLSEHVLDTLVQEL